MRKVAAIRAAKKNKEGRSLALAAIILVIGAGPFGFSAGQSRPARRSSLTET